MDPEEARQQLAEQMMQMYHQATAGGDMNRFNSRPQTDLFPNPPAGGWEDRYQGPDPKMDLGIEAAPGTQDQMPHLTPPVYQQHQPPNFRPRFR